MIGSDTCCPCATASPAWPGTGRAVPPPGTTAGGAPRAVEAAERAAELVGAPTSALAPPPPSAAGIGVADQERHFRRMRRRAENKTLLPARIGHQDVDVLAGRKVSGGSGSILAEAYRRVGKMIYGADLPLVVDTPVLHTLGGGDADDAVRFRLHLAGETWPWPPPPRSWHLRYSCRCRIRPTRNGPCRCRRRRRGNRAGC